MRVIVSDGVLYRELSCEWVHFDESTGTLAIRSASGTEYFVSCKVKAVSLTALVLSAQTPLNSGSGQAPEERTISLLVNNP